MKKSIYIVLFIVLCSCGKEPSSFKTNKKDELRTEYVAPKVSISKKVGVHYTYPIEAVSKNEHSGEGDTLYANIEGFKYTVYPDGKIKENFNGKSITTFKLQNKDIIEKAYLHHLDDNLLVYYTETDNEVAGSKVELINRRTGLVIYTNNIWGFNLGQPMISDKKSYVTSIGFVGKLDLITGKYDWKHNNLYDHQKYSFNNFDSISISSDTVAFISVHYKNKTNDKVLVADKTGKLLKIIK